MHDSSVMTKKKPTKAELLKAQIEADYKDSLDDNTGQLYNRFVAYIAEAKVPLYHALVVLDILQSEVLDQIKKKQGLI